MACKVDNNAYEIVITPQRKRKREPETPISQGLTNAGFCSTPKREAKLLIDSFNRFPLKAKNRKKPTSIAVNNSVLEVKSIAEIADAKSFEPENPYEIVRNPPKKTKKDDVKEGCFVNLALNLDVPEKRFNPFEVKRPEAPLIMDKNKCFTNAGLNIRTKENNLAVNPFEISRNKIIEHCRAGIENPALEMPTSLTISVPFQPTIGCRIDFSGLPLENFTPSKLLAEKLVFTPDVCVKERTLNKSFRRSLSVISEETIDIGQELDCYQLELENSINEAKIKKKGFEKKLQDVDESIKETDEEISYTCSINQIEQGTNTSPSLETKVAVDAKVENTAKESVEKIENLSNSNEDNYDDEIDFLAPAPFVRSYCKPCYARENVIQPASVKPQDHSSEHDGKGKITNAIRKSFRKLVHPHKSENSTKKSEDKEQEGSNFFDTIRQSLRRKHKNENKVNKDAERTQTTKPKKDKENINKNKNDVVSSLNDVSVLDIQERRVFRSRTEKGDYIKTDEVVVERRTALRSSIRQTSKAMRNQILKSVFHKKVEEYNFKE